MRISVLLAFDEDACMRLLNHLARENAILLRERPELPLLYDSRVRYERETDETWCDFINMLARGKEDCDGLAAARAGELIARGSQALRPGDGGYTLATRLRLSSIPSQVFLRTRTTPDSPGLYHCLVRYRIGSQTFIDDPSARLGMHGSLSDDIKQRWKLQEKQWRTT